MESVIHQLNDLKKDNEIFAKDFDDIVQSIETLKYKINMKNTKFCIYRIKWEQFNKIYTSRKLSFQFTGVIFCISILKDIKYVFAAYVNDGNIEKITCQMMIKQFCEIYDCSQILLSPSHNKIIITHTSSSFCEYVRIYIKLNFYV